MANECVLSVIAVSRALLVEGPDQLTAIHPVGRLRLQLSDSLCVVVKAVEQRTSVEYVLVAVCRGDGDETVRTSTAATHPSSLESVARVVSWKNVTSWFVLNDSVVLSYTDSKRPPWPSYCGLPSIGTRVRRLSELPYFFKSLPNASSIRLCSPHPTVYASLRMHSFSTRLPLSFQYPGTPGLSSRLPSSSSSTLEKRVPSLVAVIEHLVGDSPTEDRLDAVSHPGFRDGIPHAASRLVVVEVSLSAVVGDDVDLLCGERTEGPCTPPGRSRETRCRPVLASRNPRGHTRRPGRRESPGPRQHRFAVRTASRSFSSLRNAGTMSANPGSSSTWRTNTVSGNTNTSRPSKPNELYTPSLARPSDARPPQSAIGLDRNGHLTDVW